MRSNYPVSSKEMVGELKDLQETLMSLIGYDANAFDDAIDVSGSVDTLDAGISASGYAFIQSRLFRMDNPDYITVYRNHLVLSHSRRK